MELIKYSFTNFPIIARPCTFYERLFYLLSDCQIFLSYKDRNLTQTSLSQTTDFIDSPTGRKEKNGTRYDQIQHLSDISRLSFSLLLSCFSLCMY